MPHPMGPVPLEVPAVECEYLADALPFRDADQGGIRKEHRRSCFRRRISRNFRPVSSERSGGNPCTHPMTRLYYRRRSPSTPMRSAGRPRAAPGDLGLRIARHPQLIVYRIRPTRVRYMQEWALKYDGVPVEGDAGG